MQYSCRVFLFLCLCLFVPAVRAVTLDWDTVTWTAGTLSNSYDIDPAKAGNDVTVTVSGNTGQLTTELAAPNPMTPAVASAFQGGLGATEKTLCLAVNFADKMQSVTVTVNFAATYTAGVQNVSFTLFDIDFSAASGNNYQDLLSGITALSIDGTTLVAPTITTSANNVQSGSGLTQVVNGTVSAVDTGPGSGNGNVTISFGPAAIKSFTFTYGSGAGTVADPTYQHVGMYDVTFTPVPEINPAWTALGSCVLAAVLILRHSAKFRK
jgi:hypothetical protein